MSQMSTALQPGEINLDLIPINWPLTPVGGKKDAYLTGWQNKPQDVEAIKTEIEKGKCKAIGLISGPVFNEPYGFTWVDIDGPSVRAVIEELSQLPISEALPPTLTILSGREGRERKLYKVPKAKWKYFARNKYNWRGQGDGEKLEVLWKNLQGVLMGHHPLTKGYYTKEQEDFSYAQNITEVPQWLLDQMEYKNKLQGRPMETTSRVYGQNFAINAQMGNDRVIKEAVDALWALKPEYADDRDSWIKMGMVLHSVDDTLCDEWEEWSKQSDKFKPGECHKKWLGFTKGNGGVTLGTLIDEAKKCGYQPSQDYKVMPPSDETLDQLSEYMKHVLENDPSIPEEVLIDTANILSRGPSTPRKNKDFNPGRRKNEPENIIADALIKTWNDKVKFDPTTNCFHWYEYKSPGLWSALTQGEMQKKIIDELEHLKDILVPNGFTHKLVKNLFEWLKSSLLHEEWNTNKNLILFTNGVYNLETNELGLFNKDYYISRQLPYEYDPQATCEPIVTWLGEIMGGDYQMVQLLRAWMRAVLVSANDIQKFIEIVGPGKSGKSTFTNLCHSLVGFDNATVSTLDRLQSNRFELSKLPGKKLLLFNDVERYGGGVSTLKVLTGNDLANSEHKFKPEETTFKFDGLIMITANEQIQTTDPTSGLFRRRISVSFNRPFTGGAKEQCVLINCDRHKTTGKFVPYLPGLVNWLLRMSEDEMREYLLETNSKVSSYKKHFTELLTDANSLIDWLHHNVVWDLGASCWIGLAKQAPNESEFHFAGADKKLFANYKEYCRDCGVNALSHKRFVRNLFDALQNQLGLNVEKGPKRTVKAINIRLRQGAQDEFNGVDRNFPSPVDLAFNLERYEQFYKDRHLDTEFSIRFKQ